MIAQNQNMEEGELFWSVIDPIWEAVNIYDSEEVFLRDFGRITPKQQALFATHWTQTEICNGGFRQYFWKSTGILAPEAVEGYRQIGMSGVAAVIQEAMRFFDSPFPRDRLVRMDILDNYEEEHAEAGNPFDKLDDRFYELINDEAGGFDAAADAFARNDARP